MASLIIPTSLFHRLNSIERMPKELVGFLKDHLRLRVFDKRDVVLKQGDVCRNVCFIDKRLVRIFILKDKEEITIWLLKENDIFISVDSYFGARYRQYTMPGKNDSLLYYVCGGGMRAMEGVREEFLTS